MADGDKFLYTGALLYCDKGSLIMPFVAMPKKHRLYGPFIGTTLDIVPQLNIPSLGICTVTRMPCVPVLPQWEKYHDGALWIEKFRPLLVTSVCRCKCGGTIRIFDTRKSALAAASAPGASEILSIVVDGLKKRIDREIGSSLMIPPFGSILKELPYAGEVVEALGRGVRKGAADTLTGLYEMITDPLGSLGGIATLAGIAAVGYGQYTSLPNILMPAPEGYKTPEERLAKFDETFGTNLTDAHEGIKSAVDEKITEFDQADGLGKAEMTAEATGYVMVMIVDAVYGSKCTSKLSKAAKMSKLGRAARASKVGQSIAKLTNKAETLAELLKTAAKNKAKRTYDKLKNAFKGVFRVKKRLPGPEFEMHTLSNGNKVKRLKPNFEYESNGYRYKTDAQGRIIEVNGNLKLTKGGRNNYAQRTVGKNDGRLPNDQGGHLIGDQFGGSGGRENLVPMDKGVNNYNKGQWGQMEKKWSESLKNGKEVDVKIEPQYTDNTNRPSSFKVTQKIDGKTKRITVQN